MSFGKSHLIIGVFQSDCNSNFRRHSGYRRWHATN